MIRVAINGFGRIGRSAFKVWFDKHKDEMQVVAINDLVDPAALAYLLKYDSVYGTWEHDVEGKIAPDFTPGVSQGEALRTPGVSQGNLEGKEVGQITVDEVGVKIFATKDPAKLPWKNLEVDVVIESTGRFTKLDSAQAHIKAGARRVVISAPSKDTPTFLLGVKAFDGKSDVVNMGSCTTNCVGPVAKIMP